MRTIVGLTLAALLAVSVAGAHAQYPYGGYGGYPGGGYPGYGGYPGGYGGGNPIYGGYMGGVQRGPISSPVSPYLNLLNGGSPAVNYFNFVRPGLYGPNRQFGGGFMGSPFARPPFFPTLQTIDEEELPGQRNLPKKNENDPDEPVRVQLPPTGHAAGFNNSMGYFGPLMAAQGGIGSAGRPAAAAQGGTRGGTQGPPRR
jgi:hypothetical protein